MKEYRKKIIILTMSLFFGFHTETTLGTPQTAKLIYPNTRVEFSYSAYKDYEKDSSTKRKLINDFMEVYVKTFITEFLVINNIKENKFNLTEILASAKSKLSSLSDAQILQLPIGDYSKIRAELSWYASNLYNDKDYLNNLVTDIKSNSITQPLNNGQISKLSTEISDLRSALENNNKIDSSISEKLVAIENELQKMKSDSNQNNQISSNNPIPSFEQKTKEEPSNKSQNFGYILIGFIVAIFTQYVLLKKANGSK